MAAVTLPGVPAWFPVWQVTVLAAAAASAVVLWWLARPRGRWTARLRERLVLGLPVGTLLTAGLVLSVYLFVQGGLGNWYNPVTIPFRAWSYFSPLGILLAGFSHAGPGHLTGNLIGTLVFGSLAEYAWGHFPTDRGASTFSSVRTNPYARILAFPVGSAVVAVLGGAFGLGPVIGFSGVVFAFLGFALVRFPLTTVATLLAGNVVNLVWSALNNPVTRAGARPSFGAPWWAQVAIQGHALGVFVGFTLAVLLVRRRDARPGLGRLWFAVLVLAADRGLWAVYTFQGNNRFVLFRALGVALVFVMAALVVAAVAASGRPLVERIDLSRREASVGLLLAATVALAVVAVPFNLFVVTDTGLDDATGTTNPVEVRDYTVFYAEDVPNQLVSTVDVSALNQTSQVNASGVIVVSEQRNIWWDVVGKGELAFGGQRRVRVGGVDWRSSVVANRTGWSVAGGPSAYKIRLKPDGGDWRLAYVSEPATADLTIAGRNVSVAPRNDTSTGFNVLVSRNNTTLARTTVPAVNETTQAGGLRFVRDDRLLVAVRNDTRVSVAQKESYKGRR